jgi:hypothetical protein
MKMNHPIREPLSCESVLSKEKRNGSVSVVTPSRSLVETAMFRIKALFSDKLKNRTFAAQQTEAYLRVGALNKMTGLGMPESYPVT